MAKVVRLNDELYHFDCLANDVGEHLTKTLDEVDESELASLALSGEYPACADCGESLIPDLYPPEEPGVVDD